MTLTIHLLLNLNFFLSNFFLLKYPLLRWWARSVSTSSGTRAFLRGRSATSCCRSVCATSTTCRRWAALAASCAIRSVPCHSRTSRRLLPLLRRRATWARRPVPFTTRATRRWTRARTSPSVSTRITWGSNCGRCRRLRTTSSSSSSRCARMTTAI